MINENIFLFSVCAGVASVLAIGLMFPPLVASGPAGETGATYQAHISNELTYCQANFRNVNCGCFARIAAHILSEEGPRVRGFVYADRSDLARGQAGSGC